MRRVNEEAAMPVFVCGVGRSGTTLLTSLLDGQPGLVVLPGETHYYRSVFLGKALTRTIVNLAETANREWPKRLLGSRWVRPVASKDRRACAAALRAWRTSVENGPVSEALVLEAVTRGYRRGNAWPCFLSLHEALTGRPVGGASYWVEKTPGNERFVFLSEAMFNGAVRYLHVMRDPRAVVASWMVGRGLSGFARDGCVVDICHAWARSVHLGFGNVARCGSRYALVRYEDLVRAPQRVMAAVAALLGLTLGDDLLVPTRGGTPFAMNSSYGELRGKAYGVTTTQVARYRDVLSPGEIAAVEAALGPQMAQLGYPPEAKPGAMRPVVGTSWERVKCLAKRRYTAAVQQRVAAAPVSFLGADRAAPVGIARL